MKTIVCNCYCKDCMDDKHEHHFEVVNQPKKQECICPKKNCKACDFPGWEKLSRRNNPQPWKERFDRKFPVLFSRSNRYLSFDVKVFIAQERRHLLEQVREVVGEEIDCTSDIGKLIDKSYDCHTSLLNNERKRILNKLKKL